MEDIIIIAVLAVVLLVGLKATGKHFRNKSGCCGGGTYIENKKLDSVTAKKTVTIKGMTCDKCVARVTRAINEIEGASAKVNLGKKKAVVSMQKDISDDMIIAAVEKAGYEVIKIS